MDTGNGKIYELNDEESVKKAKEGIMGKLTMLTPEEYSEMRGLNEEKRPAELAVMRFIAERIELKAPHGTEVRNAFRLGYEAALKDQKSE